MNYVLIDNNSSQVQQDLKTGGNIHKNSEARERYQNIENFIAYYKNVELDSYESYKDWIKGTLYTFPRDNRLFLAINTYDKGLNETTPDDKWREENIRIFSSVQTLLELIKEKENIKNKINKLPSDNDNDENYYPSIALIRELKKNIPSPPQQSDYNQNDLTKLDYIKNRPFYEEKELIGSATNPPIVVFSGKASAGDTVYVELTMADGMTYSDTTIVPIDGTTSLFDGLVGMDPEKVYGKKQIDDIITVTKVVTKTIDDKFIPDTIARKTDINKILDPDNNPIEVTEDETFDIPIELGGLSTTTGETVERDNAIRNVEYLPVSGGDTVVFTSSFSGVSRNLRVISYDADKNFIKNTFASCDEELTVPANCKYLRFYRSDTADITVTMTMVIKGKTVKAEFKKIYFADHGYEIYGANIDDKTMHKLVIEASGKDDNEYNILEVKAPEENPCEATIALMNLGDDACQFVDFSSMIYDPDNPTVEIVNQTRGGHKLPEFSVRYNDGKGAGRVKKFTIQPDAIPIEMTSKGLKVRKNNAFDNNGADDEYVVVNLTELASIIDVDKKIEDTKTDISNDIENTKLDLTDLIDSRSIKPTSQGSMLALSDSAEAPLQGIKIFGKTKQATTTGKNKLPYPYKSTTQTNGGITTTDNGDGSLTISGTGNGTAHYFKFANSIELEIGKTYTIDIGNKVSGITYGLVVIRNDKTEYFTTFTYQDGDTISNVYMNINITTQLNKTIYPIIVEGSTYDGNWEPYTGGMASPNPDYPQELKSVGNDGSIELFAYKKNIIPYPYRFTTMYPNGIINGCTVTENKDKSITVTGTPNEIVYIPVCKILFNPGTYVMNGCPSGGYASTYNIYAYPNGLHTLDDGNGVTFTVKEKGTTVIYLYINSIGTEVNLTFKPMVCMADVNNYDYEPPVESQSLTIPTPNGLPGIPVSSDGNYTDENGQQYVSDYKDYERMVYVQRVVPLNISRCAPQRGKIESTTQEYQCFYFYNYLKSPDVTLSARERCMGDRFASKSTVYDVPTEGVTIGSFDNVIMLSIKISRLLDYGYSVDDTTTHVNALSGWLSDNPTSIIYATTAPIETPLSEEEIAAYKALHTNYPNTTIYNDEGAYTEVKYVADTKAYVDNKFAELQANILNAIQ